MKFAIPVIVAGAALLPARSLSAALLTDPAFFGQANTTYQWWNGFTVPTGPNPATEVTNANGTPTWIDTTAATDGAFMAGNHVYSFSGTLNLKTVVPTPIGTSTTVVFQAEVVGSPLDTTAFIVTPLNGLPNIATVSQVVETDVGGSGSGFGGGDYTYKVTWANLPSAASYAITYTPNQSSSSQVQARVDTLTAVSTPEPATLALLGAGGLLLRRRRSIAR